MMTSIAELLFTIVFCTCVNLDHSCVMIALYWFINLQMTSVLAIFHISIFIQCEPCSVVCQDWSPMQFLTYKRRLFLRFFTIVLWTCVNLAHSCVMIVLHFIFKPTDDICFCDLFFTIVFCICVKRAHSCVMIGLHCILTHKWHSFFRLFTTVPCTYVNIAILVSWFLFIVLFNRQMTRFIVLIFFIFYFYLFIYVFIYFIYLFIFICDLSQQCLVPVSTLQSLCHDCSIVFLIQKWRLFLRFFTTLFCTRVNRAHSCVMITRHCSF